jgi:hypothetical protein
MRAFFDRRFGHDFSAVRIHADARAGDSARAVSALAYSVGRHVVFGHGRYAPETASGRRLLAHELAHVVEQPAVAAGWWPIRVGSNTDAAEASADARAGVALAGGRPAPAADVAEPALRRACLSAAECAAPVSGSAKKFADEQIAAAEAARRRRAAMSPARAGAHGHGGHARQLEHFLEGQTAGLLANVHGIFIDQDMPPKAGAYEWDCASFTPPITGATKPCVFVPGGRNQEALVFNTTKDPPVAGHSREDWRVGMLQMLTHEIQHAMFDVAALPAPTGVTCALADVKQELTELNAIMSEFPIAFRAIPAGAGASDPSRTRLANWFNFKITNPMESVGGALKAMRCRCECSDVDRFVIDTFDFVSGSWTTAEKNAFNDELRRDVWGLKWPL